jgi:hypothetical protein
VKPPDLRSTAVGRVTPDPRRDPRCAGDVQRWHTWPTRDKQSVAHHSWNVARILLAIWPSAPSEVIVEALFHDIGEVGSGDVPFPVKRDNPTLGKEMNRVETDARYAMCIPWGVPAPQNLGDVSLKIIGLCDRLEMWEFALGELMAGNQMMLRVRIAAEETICPVVDELLGDPNAWVQDVGKRTTEYMSRRIREWPV